VICTLRWELKKPIREYWFWLVGMVDPKLDISSSWVLLTSLSQVIVSDNMKYI
jgi:hypothetical protein